MTMNKLFLTAAAVLVAASLAAGPSYAGAQQEKMKTCNKEAGSKKLKGDARKKFMSECLSGGKAEEKVPEAATDTSVKKPADAAAAEAAKPTQQDRMKACNKEAGDKKLSGDERKKFMSDCLKG
jgi:hypothetical protein